MENLPIDAIDLPSRVFYSPSEDKLYFGKVGDYKEPNLLINVMTTDAGQSYINFTRAETLIVLTSSTLTINIPNPTTHYGKKVIIKCKGTTTIGVSGAVTDGISDLFGDLTTTVTQSKPAIFISDGTVWQQIQ